MANFNARMNTIATEIYIDGSNADIEKFYNEFSAAHCDRLPNPHNSCFYPLNCNEHLMFDDNGDSCLVRFKSVCPPSDEWLKMLREKYPSFHKISVVWQNVTEIGELGFIEDDGTRYQAESQEDLKLACKLLKEHKPIDDRPVLNVVKIDIDLYRDVKDDLVIKRDEDNLICFGVYDSQTRNIMPLTAEKIAICDKYKLAYYVQCCYFYPRGIRRGLRCTQQATTEGFCDLCYEKLHPKKDRQVIDIFKRDFVIDNDFVESKYKIAIEFDELTIVIPPRS